MMLGINFIPEVCKISIHICPRCGLIMMPLDFNSPPKRLYCQYCFTLLTEKGGDIDENNSQEDH